MNIRHFLFVVACVVAAVAIPNIGLSLRRASVPASPRITHAFAPVNLATYDAWTVVYDAPPIYDKWWSEIEECTRLPVAPSVTHSVRFVYVDAIAFWLLIDPNTQLFAGYTDYEHNRIYIIRSDIFNERTVKHEMTHVLLLAHGDNRDHPAEYYDGCHLR